MHLSGDGQGRPLSIVLTAGQVHASTQLEPVLDALRVPRPGRGRPRKRPDRRLADQGVSYPRCRRALRRRGIPHPIPARRDQQRQRRAKGRRGGRPPAFERLAYRRRNAIERCINRLKQFRGLAMRYEKRAVNYRAMVVLAAIVIWLTA